MVLVCHDEQFVFMKTSKTAGTTVEMVLEPLCAPPGHVVREETPPVVSKYGVVGRRMLPARRPALLFRRWNRWVHHMPAHAVRKYLGADKWDAYKKFTIVRNPYTRAVSQFYWKNRGTGIETKDLETQKTAFASFLDSPLFKTDREIVFIGDDYVIDHALKFEDIRGGLEMLGATYELDLNLDSLPHTKNQAKKTKKITAADLIGPAEAGKIQDLMSWVFERYDYPDDPADT